jgi:5-epi-alpha-selinene synthase
MSLFSFPELYYPFPFIVNTHVDALEDYAIEWVLKFNLLENKLSLKTLRKSKFHYLAASTYPYSEFEELKIANDWYNWLFIWDDQCDMSDIGKQPKLLEVFHQRFLEILNGAKPKIQDIPLGHALADIRCRILQSANEKFLHYFIDCVSDYFYGCVLQAEYRLLQIVPDIETYIMIRTLCSAADSCLALIELGHNMVLPDSLRQHYMFKKLNYITNNLISWCNDIFSCIREIESGDIHNLVYVIHHDKLPLEKAIKKAAEIHDKRIGELIALEASFPSFGEELDIHVNKYIAGCNEWVRGHYDWYCHSKRYNTQEKLEIVKNLELIAS